MDTDLEIDREYAVELSLLWMERSARGDANGDVSIEMFVAALAALARGDGVRGIRPPAVFVLKMPWWLFSGVDTIDVAIISVV